VPTGDEPRIAVRSYHCDDLRNVKEVLSEYPSPTGRVWSEEMVKEMLSNALEEQPDGVFVAEIDGNVMGFAVVVYRDWNGIAYLDYIQVKTEWINKGVGHKLIEKCIDWAGEKSVGIIYTETGKDNERAIAFYKRHGFEITGYIPEYYRKGLDAVILVRRIN
jgi:ribosomal protein S18 acetylase RimI-like enzyme